MDVLIAPRDSHESRTHFNKGLDMMSRNQIEAAMNQFEEALQVSPNEATYLSHYGLCIAIVRKDFEAGMRLCERAIQLDPKGPINKVNLGKIYRLQGDNGAAHATFINAWKDDRSHPLPAAELSRMGIRRPPVLTFLDRAHWLNVRLGVLRARIERAAKR